MAGYHCPNCVARQEHPFVTVGEHGSEESAVLGAVLGADETREMIAGANGNESTADGPNADIRQTSTETDPSATDSNRKRRGQSPEQPD